MHALILAAGLGSRLKHKTVDCPKALVCINQQPILYYQLMNLIKASIDKVIIVIGYKGYMIKEYVKNTFPELKIVFVKNKEFKSTNSSYSFWKAKELVSDQSYLHLNCDNLFSFQLLKQIINSSHKNVIALRSDLKLGDKMVNVILDENRIIHMSIYNTPKANGKAFGLAKLSPKSTALLIQKLKNYILNGDLNQTYYGMIGLALKEMDYHCIMTDKYNLLEINTIRDLTFANDFVRNTKIINIV